MTATVVVLAILLAVGSEVRQCVRPLRMRMLDQITARAAALIDAVLER